MAETVYFDRNGGAIHADIHCGYAQEGAYILTLWAKNQKVDRWEGNFLNQDDDSFALPGTALKQAGRLLQCRAEITILPPITKWAILMSIWQGDQRLGTIAKSGESSQEVLVGVNLFARLEVKP